jgi:hypothetical protein
VKTVQKLEFLVGIATFLSALLSIYIVDYPELKAVAEFHKEPFNYDWTKAFLILILPSLLIAVSSYFHAFKNSFGALVVIVLLGGFISFFTALVYIVGVLIGTHYEGNVLVGISPGLFAFVTILLALCNALLNLRSNNKTF